MKIIKINKTDDNNIWCKCEECDGELDVHGNETSNGVNVIVQCDCGFIEAEFTFEEILKRHKKSK